MFHHSSSPHQSVELSLHSRPQTCVSIKIVTWDSRRVDEAPVKQRTQQQETLPPRSQSRRHRMFLEKSGNPPPYGFGSNPSVYPKSSSFKCNPSQGPHQLWKERFASTQYFDLNILPNFRMPGLILLLKLGFMSISLRHGHGHGPPLRNHDAWVEGIGQSSLPAIFYSFITLIEARRSTRCSCPLRRVPVWLSGNPSKLYPVRGI